ncbi:MAG: hypothetical protein LBJ00_16560 [Planctomycetaceae bacterium]|nr:hypothetical protein [Planctomycetaceae bacterium]
MVVVFVLFVKCRQTRTIHVEYVYDFVNQFQIKNRIYTEATLKFLKLNTQAQQREAVVQGRSLSPYRLRYSSSDKNLVKTKFSA